MTGKRTLIISHISAYDVRPYNPRWKPGSTLAANVTPLMDPTGKPRHRLPMPPIGTLACRRWVASVTDQDGQQ